ncbi:MAG: 16S rRNA (guanine(966)-N(2))-methyltransferase RsmD [Thermodesulfobacteriota bacterium]
MRIISGTVRGRRLFSPGSGKGDIRPTSDRAREAIFSILAGAAAGARVLDLFAGTGAMGLEALSRGAQSCLFVDRSPAAVALLWKNIDACGFRDKSVVIQRDLTRGLFCVRDLLPADGFTLVFIDPPYRMAFAASMVAEVAAAGLVADDGVVVAEARAGDSLPERCGGLHLYDRRSYGEAGFWFYETGDEAREEKA